jgi:thioredoxin 1
MSSPETPKNGKIEQQNLTPAELLKKLDNAIAITREDFRLDLRNPQKKEIAKSFLRDELATAKTVRAEYEQKNAKPTPQQACILRLHATLLKRYEAAIAQPQFDRDSLLQNEAVHAIMGAKQLMFLLTLKEMEDDKVLSGTSGDILSLLQKHIPMISVDMEDKIFPKEIESSYNSRWLPAITQKTNTLFPRYGRVMAVARTVDGKDPTLARLRAFCGEQNLRYTKLYNEQIAEKQRTGKLKVDAASMMEMEDALAWLEIGVSEFEQYALSHPEIEEIAKAQGMTQKKPEQVAALQQPAKTIAKPTVQPTVVPRIEKTPAAKEVMTDRRILAGFGQQLNFYNPQGNIVHTAVMRPANGYDQRTPLLQLGTYGYAQWNAQANAWNYEVPSWFQGRVEVAGGARMEVNGNVAQRPTRHPQYGKYFERPNGINVLHKRIESVLRDRDTILLADRSQFGGSAKWQAYEQLCQQLYIEYDSCLDKGNWPTDMAKRSRMLTAIERLERQMAEYKAEREKLPAIPPVERDAPWNPEQEKKLAWQDRLANLDKRFKEMETKYKDSDNEQLKTLYAKFSKTGHQYWRVYAPYYEAHQKRQPVDQRVLHVIADQLDRLMHYYDEAFAAAERVPAKTEVKAKGGLFGSLSGVMAMADNLKASPAGEKLFIETSFKEGQPHREILEKLIEGADLKTYGDMSDEAVEALIHLKARLPGIAGSDGALNAKDIDPITNSIYGHIMTDTNGLYARVLKEKGFHPYSKEARGIRMALNMEGMTQKETSDLSMGRFMRDRPFLSLLPRMFANIAKPNWRSDLAEGENGIVQVQQARSQIPYEVRQKIYQGLVDFFRTAHIPAYNENRDTGHANVTEADLLALKEYAAALLGVSQGSIQEIKEKTGATTIEAYLPTGLSVAFVDDLLDNHARPEDKRRHGVPTGSKFWIEGAPDTAVEPGMEENTDDENKTPKSPTTIEQPRLAKQEQVKPVPETIMPKASAEQIRNATVEDITAAQFKEKVIDSNVPVIVEFYGPRCPNCGPQLVALQSIAKKYAGDVAVVKINGDEAGNIPLRQSFTIKGYPTLIVFSGGKAVSQIEGYQAEDLVVQSFKKYIVPAKAPTPVLVKDEPAQKPETSAPVVPETVAKDESEKPKSKWSIPNPFAKKPKVEVPPPAVELGSAQPLEQKETLPTADELTLAFGDLTARTRPMFLELKKDLGSDTPKYTKFVEAYRDIVINRYKRNVIVNKEDSTQGAVPPDKIKEFLEIKKDWEKLLAEWEAVEAAE